LNCWYLWLIGQFHSIFISLSHLKNRYKTFQRYFWISNLLRIHSLILNVIILELSLILNSLLYFHYKDFERNYKVLYYIKKMWLIFQFPKTNKSRFKIKYFNLCFSFKNLVIFICDCAKPLTKNLFSKGYFNYLIDLLLIIILISLFINLFILKEFFKNLYQLILRIF
jgi:hypothetical protein